MPGVAALVVAGNTPVHPSAILTMAQVATDPNCIDGVKMHARKSKKGDLFGKYCKAYLALKELEACVPADLIAGAINDNQHVTVPVVTIPNAGVAADGGTGGPVQAMVPFVPPNADTRRMAAEPNPPALDSRLDKYWKAAQVWLTWAWNSVACRVCFALVMALFPKLIIKWVFRSFRIAVVTGAAETVTTVSETLEAAASAVESATLVVDEAIAPLTKHLPLNVEPPPSKLSMWA